MRHVTRYTAGGGTKANQIVEAGRISQTPAEVRTVCERQQTARHRSCSTARGPARAKAGIPWISGRAKHRVEGMRSKSEFGHIGLADQDYTGMP